MRYEGAIYQAEIAPITLNGLEVEDLFNLQQLVANVWRSQ
jgi:hypothetical protein